MNHCKYYCKQPNIYKEKFKHVGDLASAGNIPAAVTEFECYIIEAASKVSKFVTSIKKRCHGKIKLSAECMLMRKTCKQLLKGFQNSDDQNRATLRDAYYAQRKIFRQRVKEEKHNSQNKLITEAENLSKMFQ